MRVAAIIAALLMAIAAAVMVLPTAGGGLETSIAFQRTDIAAVILAFALGGIAAAVWNSTAGILIGAIGIGLVFAGLTLLSGNPMLGALALIYMFVGPGLALAFGLALRMATMQAPQLRVPKVKRPAQTATSMPASEPRAEIKPIATQEQKVDEPTAEEAVKPEPPTPLVDPVVPDPEPVAVPQPQSPPPPTPHAADPYVDEDAKNRLEFQRMRAAEAEDPEEGAKLWRQIADEHPDYIPAMIAEAQLLHQLGKITEARSRLDAALTVSPDDQAALTLAARYAASDQDFSAAERYWAIAFDAHDMNDGQAAAYLNALVQQQKFAEASALYHKLANEWPDRPKLIRAGASAAEGRGAYAEAHELWQAAIALEPGVFSDTRRSIAALIALGDLKAAARETRMYMQEAPDELEPAALADRIVRLATTSEAEDAMEPVAILGAANSGYWASWIEARLAAGDIVQAETAFQQAADCGSDDPALLRAGALIALRAQRRDLEAERWTALVALTPDDLGAVRRAAVAHSALGNLDAARALVEGGLTHQPDHLALLSLKANLAGRMGRWEDALQAWKAYGLHHEMTPHVIAQTSRALRGLKRIDEARLIANAGLKDAPGNLDILIEAARVADEGLALDVAARPDENHSTARAHRLDAWKAAVTAGANDPAAWQGLILALLDDGNQAGAKSALKHAQSALSDAAPLLRSPQICALIEPAEQNG